MKKYLVISVIALVLLLLWAYSNRNNKQIETSSGKTSSASTTSSKASSSSQNSEQASLQETSSSSIELSSSEDTSEPAAESSESSMNEEEIKNGDYSSIAGTWKSGTGNTLVFDANGLVSETQHLSEYGDNDMYGFVSIGVLPKQGAGGYVIAFIPKGKDYTITNAGETYKDASDHDRDRIWAGQGLGTNTDPNSFYYKID